MREATSLRSDEERLLDVQLIPDSQTDFTQILISVCPVLWLAVNHQSAHQTSKTNSRHGDWWWSRAPTGLAWPLEEAAWLWFILNHCLHTSYSLNVSILSSKKPPALWLVLSNTPFLFLLQPDCLDPGVAPWQFNCLVFHRSPLHYRKGPRCIFWTCCHLFCVY